MLGLYCHSHIKFISFCHHFPEVPARTGRQEKEREVIHSKDRSETLCLQRTQYFMWEMPRSSWKKMLELLINHFSHSVGPEHDFWAFWLGLYYAFIFILLKAFSSLTCEFCFDSLVTCTYAVQSLCVYDSCRVVLSHGMYIMKRALSSGRQGILRCCFRMRCSIDSCSDSQMRQRGARQN